MGAPKILALDEPRAVVLKLIHEIFEKAALRKVSSDTCFMIELSLELLFGRNIDAWSFG